MIEAPQKQRALFETARTLFFKYGIRRVTIEEICRESGVSKVTFYKYYKNKTALVLLLLEVIFREGREKYDEIMSSDQSYEQKVRNIIDLKREATEAMSEEFYNDLLHNSDPEIAAYLEREQQKSLESSLHDLAEAQQRGDVRADIKPEFLLYFMNHMHEMAADERLQKMYPTPQALINELVSFFFYGILTGDEREAT